MNEMLSIQVNSKILRLGSTVIQISNISSVTIGKLSDEYYRKKMNYLKFPGIFSFVLLTTLFFCGLHFFLMILLDLIYMSFAL